MYDFNRKEWHTLEEACEYLRHSTRIEIKQEQFVKHRVGCNLAVAPNYIIHIKTIQIEGVTYFDKTHLEFAAILLKLYSHKNETGS